MKIKGETEKTVFIFMSRCWRMEIPGKFINVREIFGIFLEIVFVIKYIILVDHIVTIV